MDNPQDRPFHFKHFSLFHHRSTMKTGTDAVLLGAWTSTENTNRILDAGTGCGIIALMLAQRSDAVIDALDIDLASTEEAAFNFSRSQWKHRLTAIHADLQEYRHSAVFKYDLIVSNPPFFTSSFKTKHPRRNLARHTDTMNPEMILDVAETLLQSNGKLSLVLPSREGRLFIKQAEQAGFKVNRLLHIIPVRGRMPNRMNIEFGKLSPADELTGEFVIRETNGNFTQEYITLLKNYYLGL